MKLQGVHRTRNWACICVLCLVLFTLTSYGQSCNCPPINSCGPCQGGFTDFTFRYNGPFAVAITATDGSGIIFSDLLVSTGEVFSVAGSLPNGKFQGSEVRLWITGILNYTFDTSCGMTIEVNSNYGSFTVIGAESHGNGSLCCTAPVLDTTSPVISNCPSDIQVTLGAASCSRAVTWTSPTATDNCGSVTVTNTHSPGASFSKGTTLVTYTAEDEYGNTSTCSFNVTVIDDTDPTINSCPADIVVNANGSCQATVNWTSPTVSDNCAGPLTLTTTTSPGTIFNLGTTTVTYTATDVAGNTSTCSFDVTVQDNTAPVIAGCPSNIAANADASCSAIVNWTVPTVSDNCAGTVTLTSTKNPGTGFSLGTTTVTYTATDAAGRTSTCSFDVTVEDNTNPVITGCPANIVVNSTASCQAVVNWTPPLASDNCSGVTLTSNRNPGTLFSVGTTTVTYTATDGAARTATCSFNVTVVDVTDPVIANCPSNITVNANASCQATVNWTAPTASDNCPGPITLTSTKSPGSVFTLGTTVVTYTATDVAGRTSTCSFNVTVQDNTNPLIMGCPSNIVVTANASCQATVNWTAPTVSDNCSGPLTLATSKSPGTIFSLGTTTVTYTATDVAGNASTCSFTVTVVDNTPPAINGCPANITVNANASCVAIVNWTVPTVSDNCAGTVTLASTKNPGTAFSLGTTTVTYTATDAAGRTSTCSFDVTVQDNTNPVITECPTNIVVNSTASCQAVVNWTPPLASDNCSGVTLTSNRNPGTLFSVGTTTVTYTATDGAARTATCSFNVTVIDVTNPVIANCPSNITVNANTSCQATVNWTAPTASDNCPGPITLTSTKSPGTVFTLGTTVVTYTATDVAGRTSTCSFNVTVQDNTNPVITGCPSNIVVTANASCQATVNWTAPTASDNCNTVVLSSTKSPGSVFSLGTTAVTYTATDGAGRTSTCSFNVTVQDEIKPVIAGCPANIQVNANASCQAIVNWTAPTASDNCAGPITLTSNRNPGTAFVKGTTVVTYTATDASGNTATCSFNVTVQDNIPPVISGCPSNIIVNANGSCQATVNWTAPSRTDNCAEPITLTTSKNPGSVFALGTTVVTYTATDAVGNTATCSFNVTVEDNTKPVLSGCPANIVVNANTSCQAAVNWTPPITSDNCGTPIMSSTKVPGSLFQLGTTTVTYTAVDAAGNSSTCSFNVTVVDDTAPVFAGCTDVHAVAGESCETPVIWAPPAAADCSAVNVTSSHSPGDSFPVGTTEVTYTATDVEGNTSSCKFDVVVEDKLAPVFQACSNTIVTEVDNECSTPVSWIEPSAGDNCGAVTIASSHSPGSIFPIGVTEVKYTATDTYGNISFCQFKVLVKLKSLPIITSCPEDIYLKSDENGQAHADWIPPTATAGCSDVELTSSHQPGGIFSVGTSKVEYKAEDAFGNISSCSFNVVVTQQEIDIEIGKIVTPDGNGQNDEWQVVNIEKFKENRVVIVDRWGSVIFTASGYNNENIVWRGLNQHGNMVPMGTYFYTISVRYGKFAVEKSGFIELIR